MLKIRVTFENDSFEEVEKFIQDIEQQGYKVLNKSKIYKGRGTSCYDNIYIDIKKN